MTNPTSKKDRQAAAREAAKRRRTRNILIGVIFVIVVGVGVTVWALNSTPASSGMATPAGVTADLGIPVGTATSPVVDLYEDFQCPVCKVFEDNVGPTIRQLIADGQIKAVFHIMSFLDNNLNNDSSKRSANAAGCAQDQGVFEAFHDQVYQNQPATEGVGYTNDQLLQFGRDAGVPDMTRFEQCVTNDTFGEWVAQVERNGEQAQITGTPTVLVDGTVVDWSNATSWDDVVTALTNAIDAAK